MNPAEAALDEAKGYAQYGNDDWTGMTEWVKNAIECVLADKRLNPQDRAMLTLSQEFVDLLGGGAVAGEQLRAKLKELLS